MANLLSKVREERLRESLIVHASTASKHGINCKENGFRFAQVLLFLDKFSLLSKYAEAFFI